jgi:hypothetical protein
MNKSTFLIKTNFVKVQKTELEIARDKYFGEGFLEKKNFWFLEKKNFCLKH